MTCKRICAQTRTATLARYIQLQVAPSLMQCRSAGVAPGQVAHPTQLPIAPRSAKGDPTSAAPCQSTPADSN